LFFAASAQAEVKEVVSKSGIKAWLVEEHTLPLVAMRVSFEGSGFAYDKPEGRANLAAAMLTEGAGDMGDRAFNTALEEKAIEMNTAVDADMLEVSMESLSEHKDIAFSYLGLALSKPRFDTDAVERARRQMLSTLAQAEQNPAYLLERGWAKQAFGDHPYGNPPWGTSHSLDRIDRYDLGRYVEKYLTRANMLVAVVGDITPAELSNLLDKHFSGLPEKYNPDVTVPEAKIADGGSKPVVLPYDIPQTQIAFVTPGLKRSDPDYIPAYVMNQVLAGDGNLTSKLGQEIREKRGLSYGAYSQLVPHTQGGVLEGGFATRNDEARRSAAVLRDTLQDFVKNGPTDAELARAKQYLAGSFLVKLDGNAELAAFLINMQHNKLGRDYLDKRDALIAAVGKSDVLAAARRLINPDKLILVMVGKPSVKVSEDVNAIPPAH